MNGFFSTLKGSPMSNSIINDFQNWTKTHSHWWADNPRGFIQNYLTEREPLDDAEPGEIEAVWAAATEAEREQAEAHFKSLLDVIPPRPTGDLLYVLSFLGDEDKGSHITLLGPTYFPEEDSFINFLKAAEDFVPDLKPVELTLGETVTIQNSSGLDREVHLIESSDELQLIHQGLVGLAEFYGGVLLEASFANEAFMPHLTHVGSCEFDDQETITLKRLSISMHPGARVNVPQAYSLASFELQE